MSNPKPYSPPYHTPPAGRGNGTVRNGGRNPQQTPQRTRILYVNIPLGERTTKGDVYMLKNQEKNNSSIN